MHIHNPLLALCLACIPLSAQPAQEALPSDSSFAAGTQTKPAPQEAPVASRPGSARTPRQATWVSLGGMAALYGIGTLLINVNLDPLNDVSESREMTGQGFKIAAFLAGPAAGQLWLGDYDHAAHATLIRLFGAAILWAAKEDYWSTKGTIGAVLGTGTILFGIGYSFYQPYATHPREPEARDARVGLFPALFQAPDGTLLPGLAARVTF